MEKVLIIDDEQDIHHSFKRLLEGESLSVLTAASGEEGLRVISKENPDVVIMDVRMGGISGLETLKRLRAAHPKQIVVMMTDELSIFGYCCTGKVVSARHPTRTITRLTTTASTGCLMKISVNERICMSFFWMPCGLLSVD